MIGRSSLDTLCAALFSAPSPECIVEDQGCQRANIPAAVLIPIVLRDEGLSVLLTRRADHLKDHPGQVSFPGGRVEAHDFSPLETALRETEEEVGLDRSVVSLLGYLPEYHTGTGFRVIPVVAAVMPPFSLRLDPVEVADAFEVPLGFLLDPSNHQRMSFDIDGRSRDYYGITYGDRLIWGATAGMIRSLYERMNPA